MLKLTPVERSALRAEAHALKPVVIIGEAGLTESVKKEISASLDSHGLIKVRVFGDDREARVEMYETICAELDAAPVQHIGKLLVLWRPKPEKQRAADEDRMPGPREFKVLKYSKQAGQRPEVKTLRVLGNQRLTPGGQVRRAKAPKQKSIKKGRQT